MCPFSFFHQMVGHKYLSKILFHLKRDCLSVFSSFCPVGHCFRGWSMINFKVYFVIRCLNKNLITYFAWYLKKEKRCGAVTLSIDRLINKEYFLWKNHTENMHQRLVSDPFLILVSNQKLPFHRKKSFKN